jgi:hypothetical protein
MISFRPRAPSCISGARAPPSCVHRGVSSLWRKRGYPSSTSLDRPLGRFYLVLSICDSPGRSGRIANSWPTLQQSPLCGALAAERSPEASACEASRQVRAGRFHRACARASGAGAIAGGCGAQRTGKTGKPARDAASREPPHPPLQQNRKRDGKNWYRRTEM